MTRKKSILASAAVEGKIYLSKLGILMLIKKIKSNGVQVIPEFSGKTLVIKRDSPLFFVDKKSIKKKAKEHFEFQLKRIRENSPSNAVRKEISRALTLRLRRRKAPSGGPCRRGPKGPQSESVRSTVDPWLFEGNYTIREMADKLAEAPVAASLRNKDLRWYISDRMCTLRKKGYTVQKLEGRIVHVIKKVKALVVPVEEVVQVAVTAPVVEPVAEIQPPSLLARLTGFGKKGV